MLRVFKASGEEVLAVQFAEFIEKLGLGGQPVRALDLKRHLHSLCGHPRFRQRLLLPNGQTLLDYVELTEPVDIQLILLPFTRAQGDHKLLFIRAVQENDVRTLERFLQSPQDPNVEYGRMTPLRLAAFRGAVGAVRLLLEAGANKDQADELGRTALSFARDLLSISREWKEGIPRVATF